MLQEILDAHDHSATDAADEPVPIGAQEVAQVHEELRGRGQRLAEVLEDFGENGHDFDNQENVVMRNAMEMTATG